MEHSTSMHLSYALNSFNFNLLIAVFSTWVIAFYEDIVLLPITVIRVAIFIYGIVNMINDPIAGYFSDRNQKYLRRWGKRCPWIVISGFLRVIWVLKRVSNGHAIIFLEDGLTGQVKKIWVVLKIKGDFDNFCFML